MVTREATGPGQPAPRLWTIVMGLVIALGACSGGSTSAPADVGPSGDAQLADTDVEASDAPGSDSVDLGLIYDLASEDPGLETVELVPDGSAPPPWGLGISVHIPLDGQLLLPVSIDGRSVNDAGEPLWMVIDTGAIRTAVEQDYIAEVVNGVGDVTLDLGNGQIVADYEVLAGDLSKAVDHIGVALAGLIGMDLFLTHAFALDYREALAYVVAEHPGEAPPGAEGAPLELPWELVQGYPVVDAGINGTDARLIADTGSGVSLILASKVAPELLAAGVSGYVWHTSYGSDPGVLLRLPAVDLAGVTVADTWAVVVPDDHHLSALFEMLGLEVDGFLGYPVYRHFLIGVRAVDSAYDLYPYASTAHVPANEWDRIGVELRRDEGETVIDMVFEPSSAFDLGLRPEDRLRAIDGADTDGRPLDELRRTLRGTAGETRTLRVQRAGGAEPPLDLDVAVDRLLPLL